MKCKDCRKNIVFLKGLCKPCFDKIERDIKKRESENSPACMDDINDQMNRASTIYDRK